MRAFQLLAIDQFKLTEIPASAPGPGEVTIRLQAAALNHRDVWIKRGQYAGLKFPVILGSDGAGVVEAAGSQADEHWVGQQVVLNPGQNWGNNEAAQSAEFSILGLPQDGTLAERIIVPPSRLAAKPEHLDWKEAAALPLAGLTAYRALFTRARLASGERVLVTGIGGGVATMALLLARAHGAEVWVTSSSEEKIARAVELGAKGGFNYAHSGWTVAAARTGLFSVVVDGAGGPGFESLIDLTAPGGRVVFYGATRGNAPALALRKIFWRQISLLGSTMGSPADWRGLIDFVGRHRVRPVVSDVFPLARATEAFALMERGEQFGKIVVTLDPAAG